ncbi:antibiotic biosynthesis monooxygenase family protein [Arthrobacter sp. NPDC093128]|uniref:putative quinol monooxygenase n=1 Tax=Arthrobacter sp. NPDC093128 TaxID=3154979 RepID=UPI00342B3B85
MFQVIVKYDCKPDMADKVLGLLTKMAAATRREPGNLCYEFYRGFENPRQIMILESFHTEEDFDDHQASPHFLNLTVEQVLPCLEARHVLTYTSENVPQEAP